MVCYYTIAPPQDLAPYVKSFWVYEVKVPEGQPYIHRSMADGYAEMLFHYKGPFAEIIKDKRVQQGHSLLQAPLQQCKRFITDGSFGILGVYFYPFSIPAIFGLPASAVINQIPEIDLLIGQEGRDLEEQVMLAKDNRQRLCLISGFLRRRIQKINFSSRIMAAVHHIATAKGMINVEQLAGQFCLSKRQFERKFKELAGFTPKLYARIIRFQSCLSEYNKPGLRSLTDLAYEYGYYDQSHFIHDFKEFSGYHPRQYFFGEIEGGEWRTV